jgi:hypothetical protein
VCSRDSQYFGCVCYKWQVSRNRNNSKLVEVQQLPSEIPVFPAFKDGGSNYSSGFDLANVTRYFYSTADYGEVKNYYSAELSQRGWVLSKEESIGIAGKQLTFVKGDFSIVIFHTGKSPNQGYNYAIDYVWRANK